MKSILSKLILTSLIVMFSITISRAPAESHDISALDSDEPYRSGSICEVGYGHITVTRGGWVLAGLQFDTLDGKDFTLKDIIGDQLPKGSKVAVWNPQKRGHKINSYGGDGWPTGKKAIKLRRGMAFWLHVPGRALGTDNTFEVFWAGKIPDDAESCIRIHSKANQLAYPYPEPVRWVDTQLAAKSQKGSTIYVWDSKKHRYFLHRKTRDGWTSAGDLVIDAGHGFIYKPGNSRKAYEKKSQRLRSFRKGMKIWTEERSYSFPGMTTYKNEKELNDSLPARTQYFDTMQFSTMLSVASVDDFSDTNVQVDDVDEADLVKTDGTYIYTCAGNRLVITYAYPVEQAKIVARVDLGDMLAREMFVNRNKLVIFGHKAGKFTIHAYDVSGKTHPVLEKTVELKGSYRTSRLIGNHVYAVVRTYPTRSYFWWGQPIFLPQPVLAPVTVFATENIGGVNMPITNEVSIIPTISEDGVERELTEACDVGKLTDTTPHCLVSILSLNLKTLELRTTVIAGGAAEIFCSKDNLYLANPSCFRSSSKTVVDKFYLSRGCVGYVGQGKVEGNVLNQFSMDEFDGHFRIATSVGWNSHNNLYVFDRKMFEAGLLEGLAQGERIFSARFMGKKAYLVTFRQIDPLHVLDLSDHKNPSQLGELEIPGFSRYLHPIDENHLIGVGMDDGRLQAAIFDVTDSTAPVQLWKTIIGHGSSSTLYNHKAFLFDKELDLMVLPVNLYKHNSTALGGQGQSAFRGAIVFQTSVEDGIVERERIAQIGYSSRSLLIGDMLYTCTPQTLKIHDLENLEEQAVIDLGM